MYCFSDAWESLKVSQRRRRRRRSIRIAHTCHFTCGSKYLKKSHIFRELHTEHKLSNISWLWNMPVKMFTIQSWFEYLFLWQVKYRERIPQLIKWVVLNEMQKLTQNLRSELKALHTWLEGLKSCPGQTGQLWYVYPVSSYPQHIGPVVNSLRMMNFRPSSTSGMLLRGISTKFFFIREPGNTVYSVISGWTETYIIINGIHDVCKMYFFFVKCIFKNCRRQLIVAKEIFTFKNKAAVDYF